VLFQQLLSKKTQQDLIKNNKFRYLVAVVEEEDTGDKMINGVLTIKDKNHLFHFFVKPQNQGKGIGKALWETYMQLLKVESSKLHPFQKPIEKVTVNSSDFAIPFYLKLGFVMESGRQKKNGICYTPMVYSF
jgi:GNAT superfamily N-acetyltransferase